MSQPPDLSPRAQAILRAIENETQARRQRSEASAVSPSVPTTHGIPTTGLQNGDPADQLTRLVDHVVAQTEHMRAQFRQVEQSLESLSGALAGDPEPIEPAPSAELPPSDARLTAIELALSGRSRGEVGAHLTQEFGIGNAAPILDDVFGAGSADSARTPWHP